MAFIDPPEFPVRAQRPVIAQSPTPTVPERGDPQDDTARWFLTAEEAKPAILLAAPVTYFRKNKVTAFINYRDDYGSVAQVIGSATKKNHFLYFCGWEFSENIWVDTPGRRRQQLRDLLREASEKRGVAIRALLWNNTHSLLNKGVNNKPHVDWLNSLPTGGAIHDDRFLNYGSHHQKMFVAMGGADELTGFCGGMDIAEGRLLRDEGDSPPTKDHVAWHDVQVKIEGPAVRELWRTFAVRWLDRPSSDMPANSSLQVAGLAKIAPGGGELDVQVVRTYGNGLKHSGVGPGQSTNTINTYAFAPNGEMTIYKLLSKAITEARSTIYLEDQYLVESARMGLLPSIGEVLANTIAKTSFEKMIVLVPGAGSIQGELHQVWRRRVAFWNQLGASASNKVSIYAYRNDPEAPYLMHAKPGSSTIHLL